MLLHSLHSTCFTSVTFNLDLNTHKKCETETTAKRQIKLIVFDRTTAPIYLKSQLNNFISSSFELNRHRNCMRSPHILFILFHTNRRTLYNFILLFTSSTAHRMFRPEFSSLSRTTDNGLCSLWWNLCRTRNVITWLLNNLIESNEKCMNASNNDSIKSYTHTHSTLVGNL